MVFTGYSNSISHLQLAGNDLTMNKGDDEQNSKITTFSTLSTKGLVLLCISDNISLGRDSQGSED